MEYLCIGKVKVKCTLVKALRLCTGRTAHRGSRGIALLFLDHGTRKGWGVSATPRALVTPGKTRYSLYRRQGGPQGRSGQVRKISPPPGFDSRTVQPGSSVAIPTEISGPQLCTGADITLWNEISEYGLNYSDSIYIDIDIDIIYLLTAIGSTPGGSSTVRIYKQTVHRTTQWNRIHRTEHILK